MRVLFAGTPEVAAGVLQRLMASSHEIIGVISRPDAPVGRGKTITPSPVSRVALDAGLPLLRPETLRDEQVVRQIRALEPDIAVVVAYGSLIREPLLSAFPWVNLHFSLLPAYRGAAPVQHALLNGEEITGVTAFVLDSGMDTGPILGQVTERISPIDTTGSLLERLGEAGAELIDQLLARWSQVSAKPQISDGVSLAPKIDVEMARIDWTRSAEMIDRHIRAMSPHPGAWTTVNGERLEIVSAVLSVDELPHGQVRSEKKRVLVGTGSRALDLREVRPQGKRRMDAVDWARGLREEVVFL